MDNTSNLCFFPLCLVCCYLFTGGHRQKPHSAGQTTVPGAKWPRWHLSLRAEPEDCTQDSRWQQRAVCTEAEPGTGSGAWAVHLPRPLDSPDPSLSPIRSLHSSHAHWLVWKNMCSLLSILWSKNEAFICIWSKFTLILLAQMIQRRRTLAGDWLRMLVTSWAAVLHIFCSNCCCCVVPKSCPTLCDRGRV